MPHYALRRWAIPAMISHRMGYWSQLWGVVRREIGGYFYSPIAYVVGTLFLLVQGFSFWATVQVLSDPQQRAPYGAVLRTVFGGSFLYWVVLFVVIAVVSMRTIAEERRQGTWEALVTTPLTEGALIVGKWLGAVTFYLLLWVPTVFFGAVFHAYTPGDIHLDFGPIVSAYLGVAWMGASFLAIGIAVSSCTVNQIVAAVSSFVLLMGFALVGYARSISPEWFTSSPFWRAFAELVDVRSHMELFARGAIHLRWFVLYAVIALVGLVWATVIVTFGRRRRSILWRRIASGVLIAIAAALVQLLAEHNNVVWDVSHNKVNVLSSRTKEVLQAFDAPMDVLVVRAQSDAFAREFQEVERVIEQFVAAQPLLRYETLDPALQPEAITEVAREFALAPLDLHEGGVVVFRLGQRKRAVDLLDVAGFDRDSLGVGRLSDFRAEAAFASAIAQLVLAPPATVCFLNPQIRWDMIRQRLKREGVEVKAVSTMRDVPIHCDVLVLVGPDFRLQPKQAILLANYLNRGGRLLVALGMQDADAGEGPIRVSGLATVLAEFGIVLPAAVVVDPAYEIDLPYAWTTTAGYGDHPIVSAFSGRRVTAWWKPRAVVPSHPADPDTVVTPLVRSSESGWGEIDLSFVLGRTSPRKQSVDLRGPVAVAVAAEQSRLGTRIVVLGSAESFSDSLQGVGSNGLFAMKVFAWLTGRAISVVVEEKTPEVVRLVMTRRDLQKVFLLSVVVIPVAFGLFGALLWWYRRRG